MASPWTDETSLERKWDNCAKDALLKTSAGAGIGLVFTFLLRNKRWPLTLGLGVGLGELQLNNLVHCHHCDGIGATIIIFQVILHPYSFVYRFAEFLPLSCRKNLNSQFLFYDRRVRQSFPDIHPKLPTGRKKQRRNCRWVRFRDALGGACDFFHL